MPGMTPRCTAHWAPWSPSMIKPVDLVVIGAGLAGLSLAATLARGGYAGRVVLLEPRKEYVDDRSWAFWTPNDHALPVTPARQWRRWQFSEPGSKPRVCSAEGWRYAYVRSLDFYRAAVKSICSQPNFNLIMGAEASAVTKLGDYLSVATRDGAVSTRFVVDTRPAERERFAGSILFQSFLGRELKFDQPRCDDSRVELMTDMRSDALGFVFSYVLPLSPHHALVEATRFSARPVDQTVLAHDLDQLLSARDWSSAEVLRTEAAVLPMGLPAPDLAEPMPGVVRAGSGAGALRAASGFGFVRIQAWAERCARELLHGRAPVGHPAEPRVRGWMDQVFLRALARHPERSPEFFRRLAASVPGETFVRFMSDQGGWLDHARVIAALPPGPFLQAMHTTPLRTRPAP